MLLASGFEEPLLRCGMSMIDQEICQHQMYANRGMLTGNFSSKIKVKICVGLSGG